MRTDSIFDGAQFGGQLNQLSFIECTLGIKLLIESLNDKQKQCFIVCFIFNIYWVDHIHRIGPNSKRALH